MRKLAPVLPVLALAAPVLAWGNTGHVLVNRLAVDALPDSPLKSFFKKNQEWIAAHGVDPDKYKARHRVEEAPKHYLDLCENGIKPEEYPRTWKGAVDKFGLQAATKQGKLPWTIEEVFQELVKALEAKDGTKALDRATWLGHYVGDALVPFHACTNHDGQLTQQKGIHSLWEQNMIEHNLAEVEKEVRAEIAKQKVAELSGDPCSWAFEKLLEGDKLAHDILGKDKGRRASGREKALYAATGDVARKRLTDAVVGLASLWHTAWVRAGKPQLPLDAKVPGGETGKADEDHGAPEIPPGEPKPAEPKGEPRPSEPAEPKEPKEGPTTDPAPAPPPSPAKPSAKGQRSGFAGLWVRDDDDQPGAVVDCVEAGTGPASIYVGDAIIAVDGAPINSVSTFTKRVSEFKPGDLVPLTILRSGQEVYVKIRL